MNFYFLFFIDACGGIIYTENSTISTITSPLYPDFYPILKNCVWEIVAPSKYNVFLNFSYFDLEGDICSYDYLAIYSKFEDNRLKRIGTFCGSDIPPVIKSERNILRLEFKSDKSIQKTGFSADFFTGK